MQLSEGDTTAWQWIAGAAYSLAAALVAWAWKMLEGRIARLEKAEITRDERCDSRHEEVMAEMRKDLIAIIREAVSELVIGHNKELASLDKSLALQAQLLEKLQEDVSGLSNRIERRLEGGTTAGGYPTSRRRRDD